MPLCKDHWAAATKVKCSALGHKGPRHGGPWGQWVGSRLRLGQSKDLEEAVLPQASLSGFKGLLLYLPEGGFSFGNE